MTSAAARRANAFKRCRPRQHEYSVAAPVSTNTVDDVDAMCEELRRRGATILSGPMERPWGIRTASFRDPGGHIWEIAK